jgi:hypothetical protein
MPVFSYFIVMGTLLGTLLWFIGNTVEPAPPEIRSSPMAGLPRFKAEPEAAHAQVTTVNFAAAHKRPTSKSDLPVVAAKPRKSLSLSPSPAASPASRPSSWTQTAEYPHDRLTIH